MGFAALAGTLALLVSPHALAHDVLILAVPGLARHHALRFQRALPNPIPPCWRSTWRSSSTCAASMCRSSGCHGGRRRVVRLAVQAAGCAAAPATDRSGRLTDAIRASMRSICKQQVHKRSSPTSLTECRPAPAPASIRVDLHIVRQGEGAPVHPAHPVRRRRATKP